MSGVIWFLSFDLEANITVYGVGPSVLQLAGLSLRFGVGATSLQPTVDLYDPLFPQQRLLMTPYVRALT